jgi:glycosyltransferase involved in cell wall biosynthesis
MADALVSVITPTWQRRSLLLDRCIPSVLAQDYPAVEHVIVSDGYEDGLYPAILDRYAEQVAAGRIQFDELAAHDPAARWGHRARLRGIEAARGEYIAWLDDDNAYRPQHLSMLTAALEEDTAAGFAYSLIQMNGHSVPYIVGGDPPFCGGIDTSAMFCRRTALDVATWRDDGQQTVDWDLAERWMAAGMTWVHVPHVTADYYFSP